MEIPWNSRLKENLLIFVKVLLEPPEQQELQVLQAALDPQEQQELQELLVRMI